MDLTVIHPQSIQQSTKVSFQKKIKSCLVVSKNSKASQSETISAVSFSFHFISFFFLQFIFIAYSLLFFCPWKLTHCKRIQRLFNQVSLSKRMVKPFCSLTEEFLPKQLWICDFYRILEVERKLELNFTYAKVPHSDHGPNLPLAMCCLVFLPNIFFYIYNFSQL